MIHECKNKITINDNLKKKKGMIDERYCFIVNYKQLPIYIKSD